MDINDLFDSFTKKEYDRVILIGEEHMDSSPINNYYTLLSMVIWGDMWRALSFMRRSILIKENLAYLEEGGANFKSLALLSLSEDKIDLALMLFMCNFINAVFKEELDTDDKLGLFIRMNEMIDDLYSAGASSEYLRELTKNARLLSSEV